MRLVFVCLVVVGLLLVVGSLSILSAGELRLGDMPADRYVAYFEDFAEGLRIEGPFYAGDVIEVDADGVFDLRYKLRRISYNITDGFYTIEGVDLSGLWAELDFVNRTVENYAPPPPPVDLVGYGGQIVGWLAVVTAAGMLIGSALWGFRTLKKAFIHASNGGGYVSPEDKSAYLSGKGD